MSYDGARVLETSGRPMLVIGRSYEFVSIQDGRKLAEETMEKSGEEAKTGTDAEADAEEATK